jgi:hypothetical protein
VTLELLGYTAIGVAALFAAPFVVYGVWWAIGKYRVLQAGPRPLRASRHLIWRAPEPTKSAVDADALRGAPQPPFQFIEEHLTGTQPCVSVRDSNGLVWRVKWGDEVRSETFAVRFAASCGYFAAETYFIPTGTIVDCAPDLKRARECIQADSGQFCDARFQLDDPSATKLFEEHSWSWHDNPFVGTPELSGLKIVVMLLSNWDTKDRRDLARGSNTAIFEYAGHGRSREARYLLSDWGGSMGRWGATIATRGRWDPDGFVEQTPQFVTGIKDGCVVFGYSGQRTADVADGISLAHVRWFRRFLGAFTEEHLTRELHVSGATPDEARCFATALLSRIDQLSVAEEGGAAGTRH